MTILYEFVKVCTVQIMAEKPRIHLVLSIMESLYLTAMWLMQNLIMSVIVIILSACTKIRHKADILDCTQISSSVFRNAIHFIIGIPFNLSFETHTRHGTAAELKIFHIIN